MLTRRDENTFECSEITSEGLPKGEGLPTEQELFGGLHCQPGFVCTRKELAADIKTLYATGLFERVNAKVLPAKKKGKFKVLFELREKIYPKCESFEVKNAKSLPPGVVSRLRRQLVGSKRDSFTMQDMSLVKRAIDGWYQKHGYGLSYIAQFKGMNSGNVVVEVVEGRTDRVQVVWMNERGTAVKGRGNVDPAYIQKFSAVKPGQLYSLADGRRTLQNVFALDLFDNVQILPRQNERDPTKVEVDIMVREKPMQTADIEAEWGLAADAKNRPSLVSFVPGGTITYENRNLDGRGGMVAASVNTKSFLNPADDLSYRVLYSRPFVAGLRDPRCTKLQASAFNARRLCGVFTPGPDGEEVPPVWVDRQGARVGLTQELGRGSRGAVALVAQEIVTRDETGAPCARGGRVSPLGAVVADGPPTTIGADGVDRVVHAQASLVRDTTYIRDGATRGARDVVTVDQGLGIGTGAPLFNRMTASATRFLGLFGPKLKGRLGPGTLVLHGRAGAALGDLPAYETFLLGGPYSVRGYNVGELAACRRFAEAAAEARLSVLGKTVYAFAEAGSDLGSSKEVRGNPTAYFRRAGAGSSVGGGVKISAMRVEAVRDNNAGKWHVMLHYGERF